MPINLKSLHSTLPREENLFSRLISKKNLTFLNLPDFGIFKDVLIPKISDVFINFREVPNEVLEQEIESLDKELLALYQQQQSLRTAVEPALDLLKVNYLRREEIHNILALRELACRRTPYMRVLELVRVINTESQLAAEQVRIQLEIDKLEVLIDAYNEAGRLGLLKKTRLLQQQELLQKELDLRGKNPFLVFKITVILILGFVGIKGLGVEGVDFTN